MARGLLCVVNGISGAFGVALVVEGSEGMLFGFAQAALHLG